MAREYEEIADGLAKLSGDVDDPGKAEKLMHAAALLRIAAEEALSGEKENDDD